MNQLNMKDISKHIIFACNCEQMWNLPASLICQNDAHNENNVPFVEIICISSMNQGITLIRLICVYH